MLLRGKVAGHLNDLKVRNEQDAPSDLNLWPVSMHRCAKRTQHALNILLMTCSICESQLHDAAELHRVKSLQRTHRPTPKQEKRRRTRVYIHLYIRGQFQTNCTAASSMWRQNITSVLLHDITRSGTHYAEECSSVWLAFLSGFNLGAPLVFDFWPG